MSRRSWPRRTPKEPPDHGLRVKQSGTTWWGQRWVAALENMSSSYAGRLARGRSYARAGRVHDLAAEAGAVTGKVTGSRARPYRVFVSLVKLSDEVWDGAIAAMAGKAQFAAELLAGQMPEEIDAAFQDAGASLFPAHERDLATDCSCPDWANPCKHLAATHYVLGEALDRDPFLLFELRGRSKAQVLEALRAARGRTTRSSAGGAESARAAAGDIAMVSLSRVRVADYDTLRAPLPALHLSFAEPSRPGELLRQLGEPGGWDGERAPAEVLGPLIQAAAARASWLAVAEPAPEGETESAASTSRAGARANSSRRTKR